MQTLGEIKSLLDARGLRPKRSLGQNFLIDHNLISKLVDAAQVRQGDVVLEVGPGTGTMTEELLDRGASVIACELDDALAELNRERHAARLKARGLPPERFTLIHADCLEDKHTLSPLITQALAGRAFKLVANLPYGAATPLMSTLLVGHPQCSLLGVTVQREVADRVLAQPSTKDFGPLSVIAQALCRVERIATAGPQCFWPPPDVTSAMILLTRRNAPSDPPLTDDPAALSRACRVLFAQRRKQLGGVLGARVHWDTLRLDPVLSAIGPTSRAEQLTVPQIVALSRYLTGIDIDAGD